MFERSNISDDRHYINHRRLLEVHQLASLKNRANFVTSTRTSSTDNFILYIDVYFCRRCDRSMCDSNVKTFHVQSSVRKRDVTPFNLTTPTVACQAQLSTFTNLYLSYCTRANSFKFNHARTYNLQYVSLYV